MQGDRGRVVIGAITRIVGCLAIIVVLFHDGVVLGLGQVTADQDAQVAARAAATTYLQNNKPEKELDAGQLLQKSYDAAALSVASKGTDIDPTSFTIDTGLRTVTVHASRGTSTMLAGRFHWFDKVTHPTSSASATIEDNSP